ncbi:hypothetical protein ACHAWF_008339 [Thalassiosira exigua]
MANDRPKKKGHKQKSKKRKKSRTNALKDNGDNKQKGPEDKAKWEDRGGGGCLMGGGKESLPEQNVDISPDSGTNKGWSWGAAFAAASKVEPNDADLDANFLAVAEASDGCSKDLMSISQLASNHKSSEKNDHGPSKRTLKRSRSDSSVGSNDPSIESEDSSHHDHVSLEGQMVPIRSGNSSNMSLVLIHKRSGKVYSSGPKMKNGHRLVIGKMVKGQVKLDSTAVEQMRQLDEGPENETGPSFPFPTNPDDHCETQLLSYEHILPIMDELCKSFGGARRSMKIYDPYYCNGSVVKHLSALGFSNVYNKKEDCYAVWKSTAEPDFDLLLTNPPYSEDHIERLMNHVTSRPFGNKPWLLLMPQWVHKKDYYINVTTKKNRNPFYIVPKKRYVYSPPVNFREKKESDTHKKNSPFVSMWFCWGGTEKRNQQLIDAFKKSDVQSACDLARSKNALRDLRRGGKGKKKEKARMDNKFI